MRHHKPRPHVQVSRTQSRSVICPNCGAQPTEKCVGLRGPREASHLERTWAYLAPA